MQTLVLRFCTIASLGEVYRGCLTDCYSATDNTVDSKCQFSRKRKKRLLARLLARTFASGARMLYLSQVTFVSGARMLYLSQVIFVSGARMLALSQVTFASGARMLYLSQVTFVSGARMLDLSQATFASGARMLYLSQLDRLEIRSF